VDGARRGGPWADLRYHAGGWPLALADIPNDQGGRLRLSLRSGVCDTTATAVIPVSSYAVWRRVPPGALAQSVAREAVAVPRDDAAAGPAREPGTEAGEPLQGPEPFAAATHAATGDVPLVTWAGRTFASPAASQPAGFPGGTWELVATVPAFQQPSYLVEVPTLSDSGATGANDAVFVVTTHTPTPSIWWVSDPDSARSVDNIAPGVPQGLSVRYGAGGGNQVTWQAVGDADFQYYRVYRGTAPGFTPAPENLAAAVASPAWTDPAGGSLHYAVTAVDHNGNESAPATPGTVLDAIGAPAAVFALEAPWPSPFRGATRVGFSLPRAGEAALEVFDAAGRRVRTLARGSFAAGDHAVSWDGRGDGGARLGAGIYFLRLSAGAERAVRRVVRLD
jgi:hypothetical protein